MSEDKSTSSDPDQQKPKSSLERTAQIEETLSFQQRHLEEFQEVVMRQQAELDLLRRDVERLKGEVHRLGEETGSDLPADEKPPHY